MSNLNTSVPLPVASDLSASRHAAVYMSATGVALAGPGNRVIGTLFEPNKKHDPDTGSYAGDACTVFLSAGNGLHDVLVGNATAITMGDELELGASGVYNKKTTRTVTAATTDIFTSTAHGFVVNQPITFLSIGDGVGTGLVAGATYYIISTSLAADTFKVSATVGGSSIDVTTAITTGGQATTYAGGVAAESCPASSNGGGRIHAILYPAADPIGSGAVSAAFTGTGSQVLQTSPTLITPVLGVATGTSLAATGAITSSGTAGIGYATGAGGTVTQATNKSTGVTLSKMCGAITLNNAALAAAAEVTFTVTNTLVAATDAPYALHSSAGTSGSYLVNTSNVTAGTFDITVSNVSAGSLSEAIVLTVYIHKAVAA